MKSKQILAKLEVIFRWLGYTLLAFSALTMVFLIKDYARPAYLKPLGGGQEDQFERGHRLMLVTCAGFILGGIMHFAIWIKPRLTPQDSYTIIGSDNVIYNVLDALSGLLNLVEPTLYAITIFILYRHFVQIFSFEAEVV